MSYGTKIGVVSMRVYVLVKDQLHVDVLENIHKSVHLPLTNGVGYTATV